VPDALPPPPPAIVITGTALPEAKAELVDTVERITQRQIAQSPTHELDQLLKDVPGIRCSAARTRGSATRVARRLLFVA
jgi:outer membrane receptor for ferrienterochelin and colicin